MSTHANHPFHLVDYSPWHLTGAIGAMTSVSGLVKWFHQYDISLFVLGNIITVLTVYQWWRDVSSYMYHVLIGITFLLVCLIRHLNNHFSKIHHFGFEAAAWYWHFVDIVWLFLYI